jgi:hypothetical protein
LLFSSALALARPIKGAASPLPTVIYWERAYSSHLTAASQSKGRIFQWHHKAEMCVSTEKKGIKRRMMKVHIVVWGEESS